MVLPALLMALHLAPVAAIDTPRTITPPPVIAQFLPQNTRPRDTTQNHVVLHNDGAGLPASVVHRVLHRRGLAYHYFIARNGTIHQFMPLNRVAEHAGRSRWQEKTHWNDFSIGICLQGTNQRGYTAAQYESLRRLLRYLYARYPDSRSRRVVGHQHIASPRGRKHDPGKFFRWNEIHEPRFALRQ